GEGEAEHALGPGQAVGHQPDQPGRHRLALPRPGAGDDGHWAQRGADHGGLLGGGLGHAEQPRELRRAVPDTGVTSGVGVSGAGGTGGVGGVGGGGTGGGEVGGAGVGGVGGGG